MKLVFYSGGQDPGNQELHAELSHLVGHKRHKTFTYVPYLTDDSTYFFRRAMSRYRPFGFTNFYCLPVDQGKELSSKALHRALGSDVIYLAGGNTFYFLKHLRQSGLLQLLPEYVNSGGVLAGLSAGGIIMTKNINLAAYPSFDADDNDVNLFNWSALDLVDFEFFPHYEVTNRHFRAMKSYTKEHKCSVFACCDGGGVIVNGEEIKFVGEVYLFHNGKSVKVHGS